MNFITLDQATIEALRAFPTGVQVRDSAGTVIGFFRPAPPVYEEGEVPSTSDEELDRREKSGNKMSTDEVLNRLRKRA